MLLHTLLLFVFKIVKSRMCILKGLIKQEVYIKRHDKISKTSEDFQFMYNHLQRNNLKPII